VKLGLGNKEMFTAEANMNKPVGQWLKSLGLAVKTEFITPWGICDLVGSSVRKQNLARRLRLGQMKPVSSLTRTTLLLGIPDIETGSSVTLASLVRKYAAVIGEDVVVAQTQKLINDGFVLRQSGDRLQKLNGWIPLHKRLIAVELKLTRIEEAMSQAHSNLSFADESYVALPKDLAYRVAAKPDRWSGYFDFGVGLLAVSSRACAIVKKPQLRPYPPDPVLQFYCVEKFWRNYSKGS
jgi:hypothetical protein